MALAAGLAFVAVFSGLEGGRAWVIALTAAVLALWMGESRAASASENFLNSSPEEFA